MTFLLFKLFIFGTLKGDITRYYSCLRFEKSKNLLTQITEKFKFPMTLLNRYGNLYVNNYTELSFLDFIG